MQHRSVIHITVRRPKNIIHPMKNPFNNSQDNQLGTDDAYKMTRSAQSAVQVR